MAEKDPRCNYVANIASSCFNNPSLQEAIAQAPEVAQFLNELSNKVLQIISDGKQFRCFSNQVANPPPGTLEVHFVKVAQGSEEITGAKVAQQLLTSSVRNSSVQSLYQYLSNIYAPVLFGEQGEQSMKKDNQLRELVMSLKAGLQKTLRKGGLSMAHTEFNQDEFRGILSPVDEIEAWIEVEREGIASQGNEKLRAKAELINKHFAKASKQIAEMETMDLGQVSAMVDSIQDSLDGIWQDPNIHPVYPQPRMEHFFKVTTRVLGARVEREFKQTDIWQTSFSNVRLKLNECMKVLRGWKDRCTELTREFWRSQRCQHKWNGKPFYDIYLENIIIRMTSIFELRSQHDELLRLLSPEEQERLAVNSTFDPFRKINSFYTDEYAENKWSRAVKIYEQILEPMEKEICQKLRKEIFQDGKATPSQLLREFQRWKGLLSKDTIKNELQRERENLQAQLIEEVQKYREEFEGRTGQSLEAIPGMEKPPQTANVSDTVAGIIWSRQMSQKLQNNLRVAQGLFSDIQSIEKFQAESQALCKQIRQWEQSKFQKWLDEIQRTLKDPDQKKKLEMTGQLMEFDYEAGGLLKVNYSERLVTLTKDARVLGEHGFTIPPNIHAVTENAKKFYKEGVTLKQVANFYNSMSQQIVNCQKPMMLEKAQQFEHIIKNPQGKKSGDGSTVTWKDPIEIENYIKEVQMRATELINENRKLRKVHITLTDQIIELMNVDLLKNQVVWKDNLKKMRVIIESVTKTRQPEMCKLWLTHLNFQLYKALEFQYQMGLESLNEHLPEIPCELMLGKDQQIGFRPAYEELKSRYYKQIQNFLTIPLRFRGLEGSRQLMPDLFKIIPDQNSAYLAAVYGKAEELFDKLLGVRDEYKPWTILGRLDLAAHIEEYFTQVADWDANFQILKQKRKELKKLPDEIKIDCININVLPFKSGVENLFKRLQDILIETLQESIEKDHEHVEQFIRKGLDKLRNNPQSVEEIEQMHTDAVEIGTQKGAIVKIFDGCELKNKMIKQITGQAMRLGNIEGQWREFDARLGAFQDKIDEQKDRLKQELDTKITTLSTDLEKMFDRWQEKKPKERNDMSLEEALETAESMRGLKENWGVLEDRMQKMQRDCKNFGREMPKLTYYDQMKGELEHAQQAWGIFEEFKQNTDEMGKEEWLTFRKKEYFKFQDFFLKQQEQLKNAPKSVVTKFLSKQIENYQQAWPIIKLCTGESFEKEHWRRLTHLLNMPKDVTFDNMTFQHLIDSVPDMIKNAKEIKVLAERAQGEVTIREAINELRVWCETCEFELHEHESNGRTTSLVKEWKEILTQVSDKQSLILSLKESRYVGGFQDQIEQFEKKFGGIDDYLAKLNVIQRKWVYLEPIFMRGALPQEQGRFRRVDDDYRSIANGLGTDPKVMSLTDIPGLKDTLENILTQIDQCQKALNDFLEEKRQKFSRFYFIGDEDLLEILGQARNPTVIQLHLKKLFAGIHKVAFGGNNTEIKAMISSVGEQVALAQPIQVKDEVEVWLGDLEKVMRITLDSILKDTLKKSGLDIVNTPSQICQLAQMIQFSENCSSAIQAGKLENYHQDLKKQLEGYAMFDHKGDHLLFSKIKALILDLIHMIDVVEQLMKDQVAQSRNPSDWMWYKQLKYYIDARNKNQCMVGMCDAFFDYTFEYQGNAPKLVHTPLTDKCYLTLVMGMKLGFGGNPYGPAGTGKTESVKALGQAFGRQVLVFNCDEGLDYKAMGRIFIGLVKCGAWGCFDEFNRLLEEQLSAISQQIQVIQWAIKQQQPSMSLLGRNIPVNKNAGIFVTLNPAGKGYGGRSKLPDNLKQLFRPVAMSAPDLEQIAETYLYSEGFKEAQKLARKTVSLFKLCSQLLSKQQHYDWALRAQKTIISTAGQLIQQELKKGRKLTYEAEALILIKSIRVNTISKLTYADSQQYEQLQADMFPGAKSEDIDVEELRAAIKASVEELKLENIEKQVQKILQFYEATKQRMGVVIVGPSGCGKTTIWKVLKMAYEKMGQQLMTHVMNPKSMPREQLLGLMNHDTREFQDGVLTYSARLVVKEPSETLCWIVCDGDIDPEWIESLNSVLDDNHLLTLPNGERISFGDNVNFIFETNDLKFASPATVTRLGMIFLSEEDVDVNRITKTWMKKQKENMVDKLDQWLQEIFFPCLEWTLKHQDHMITDTTKVGITNNALSYLVDIKSKGEFTFGCMLGLGSNFNYHMRGEFYKEIYTRAQERPIDPKNLLFNYYDTGMQKWNVFVQETKAGDIKVEDLNDPAAPPIVKTTAIQRDMALVKPLFDNNENFILVGPDGCGKRLIIRNLVQQMKNVQMAVIHCNARTSAVHVIQKLSQMCSQTTNSMGRVYRPKECQRLVLFLKDINLPIPDKYETIQLISFLQQIVCYKGFYDTNLEFVSLERIQIVCSMNPSTTIGRHKISSRFTANVRICYMDYPNPEELLPVYSEIMRAILVHERFGKGAMANSTKRLSQFLIDLYSNVKQKFSVDEHRHYLFTPREVTLMIFSMLRYEIPDPQQLIEIMIYESQRIFKDRLVDKDSKKRFDQILYTLLKNHLKFSERLVDTYYISKVAAGDSLIKGLPNLGRISKNDFVQLVDQQMRAYEREFKELDIHLIDEVLDLFAYVERSLSQQGGCLLLAGRAGVGRKQATQLISHMLNAEFYTPNINRDYGMKEFKRDIKKALEMAGVQGSKTVFYIEDHQILKDEFLTYVNSLISSGEIPGLYTPEELEPILNQLKDEMATQYEARTLFEFFVLRVKKNLSVVLSLDNQHPKFQQHCSQNPALFTRCTILWSDGWSKESMVVVAKNELKEVNQHLDKHIDQIINSSVWLHQHVSTTVQTSPQIFVNMIQCFREILVRIVTTSGGQSKHLMAGLEKLDEAKVTVDKLTREAQGKQVELSKAQKEASESMKVIQTSMEQKAAAKQEVEKLSRNVQKDARAIDERKVEVEHELGDVQPQVDAAKSAVGQLKPANLNEVKNFRVPPDPVTHVLGACMQMLGQDDITWAGMKRFLGTSGVIQQILGFNARQVTNSMKNKVMKIVNQYPSSFEQETIFRVSKATAPLAQWCIANIKFSEVLLKIEPLTNELDKLTQKLQQSQDRVNECQAQLNEIDKQTEVLNADFQKKTMLAAMMENKLKVTEETLKSASTLLHQLSGENERWKVQVRELNEAINLVPLRSLVSAAYITYLGAANESSREKVFGDWRQQLKLGDYHFRNFLSSEQQMLTWKKEGLPADSLSMENAIMIMNSIRAPLIIDPATQATDWIKANLKKEHDNVEVLNHQDSKFNTNIELAIRFGKVLVIQEVDGIESLLVPILRKDLLQQGPRQVVQIGEKAVDYNPNFRLYLTTRDQFVEIPPNCQPLVTNVNFTVTKSGLEGQLLSITINFEQPELEARKTTLLEDEERLKIQLAGYEKALLTELANSQGNILENKSLIDSLNQTKAQSSQIEQALSESKNLQVSLDQQREVYRDFAIVGSDLFMVFGDLIKMNNMYQFSLSSFIKLFKRALEIKPDAKSTEEKLSKLSDSLIKICYSEIGRSLFKADRLTYSMHFIRGVYPKLFADNEWEFFSGMTGASSETQTRMPRWLAADRAEIYGTYCNTFGAMVPQLGIENEQQWSSFGESGEPEINFPQHAQRMISSFHKVILIQVLRPDRLESAMTVFIKEAFGNQNVQAVPFNLQNLYAHESNSAEPVLFIISPGSDPSAELQEFAEQEIGRQAFHEIAMGGGTNETAIDTIKQAALKGEWVCLKNLHLVTPWLSILEKEFKMLTPEKNFRLWLTSEPHVKFPSILLQSSQKITYETPPGVRNNLQRTFQYVTPSSNENVDQTKMQILFMLSWFHSLIQERRKFIPQGWVKYYEFSYGDLKAGEMILSGLLKETQGRGPSWQKIFGLFENAIYGGRVDNEFDMRVLRAYMDEIFTQQTLQGQSKLSNLVQVAQSNNARDFAQLISQLPEIDTPTVFGLPTNIDRSVQRFNSGQVLSQLKSLAAVSVTNLRFDKEKWTEALGPLCSLWKNVYKSENYKQVQISNSGLRSSDPVEVFVYMEMMSAMDMLKNVDDSMTSIMRVLQGQEMLTPQTQKEAQQLMSNEVPEAWEKQWCGPENPGSWVRIANRKGLSLTKWVQRVQAKALMKEQIGLNDLFHPETFLNAFRQRNARLQKVAIDELKLVSNFKGGSSGEGTIILKGLWLQGSSFNGSELAEVQGQAAEIQDLPPCSVSWIPKDQPEPVPKERCVEVPVYHNLDRQTLLCTFDIPNSGEASKRIISGVALFLNGSE